MLRLGGLNSVRAFLARQRYGKTRKGDRRLLNPHLERRRLRFETFASIFTAANFCFCTTSTGRSPTFYFAKGGLAGLNKNVRSGRLRTMHDDGPLIEVTDRPRRHLFCRDKARLENIEEFEVGYNASRDAWSDLEDIRLGKEVQPFRGESYDYRDDPKVRATPLVGDHHFEYVGRTDAEEYADHHLSEGRIALTPRPTVSQINRLLARLFDDEAAVEIDGRTAVAGRGLPARQAIVDLGRYLASL